MDARSEALAEIVARARQHHLTAQEIASALGEPQAGERGARNVLVRVLAYMGGTFVFAGLGIFIALRWELMGSAARVVITLGSGLAACVLAVLSNRDPRFEKAAAPLFLVTAALEPTGMMVAFQEFGSGGDWRWAALVTAGTVGVQFLLTFARLRLSTLLFLSICFVMLFWWTAFDLLDVDGDVTALVLGAALVLAAVGIDRTSHSVVTPLWYLTGAAAFLFGLFDAVRRTPFELLFLLSAAGFVYLSAVLHSRTLLLVATVAMLAYTAWFTGEHFAESVGWPLALIAFGLLMIALSALAFRIDRRYVRPR